jgi:hypothetical protein
VSALAMFSRARGRTHQDLEKVKVKAKMDYIVHRGRRACSGLTNERTCKVFVSGNIAMLTRNF